MKIVEIKIEGRKRRLKDCKGLSAVRGLMFDDICGYDGALIHANSIWMPFVRHKLMLFFLDKNMKILSKQKAVPLKLNPATWKIYSDDRAKYCAEIKLK